VRAIAGARSYSVDNSVDTLGMAHGLASHTQRQLGAEAFGALTQLQCGAEPR